jgi:hypothetical protein
MSDLIQIKVHKNKCYTTIGLKAVEDPRLSWKAKGLHLYLYSRPSGWQIRYTDLLRRSRDGKCSLQRAVEDLKRHGYLRISQIRKQGKFGRSLWEVYEEPCVISPYPDFPDTEKPDAEKPHPENRTLNNKHSSNNHLRKTTTTEQKVVVKEFEKIHELIRGTPFEKIPDDLISRLMRKYKTGSERIYHILDVFTYQFQKGWQVDDPLKAMISALKDGITEPLDFVSCEDRQNRKQLDGKDVGERNEHRKKTGTAFKEAEKQFDSLSPKEQRPWLMMAKRQASGFTGIDDAIRSIAIDLYIRNKEVET